MKMFKKSNRKFRSKRDSSDEDADSNSNSNSVEVISAPAITVAKKPAVAAAAAVPVAKNTVLSFDLEEDEGEEFKIKKSKESRRMVKEKKKERKHRENDNPEVEKQQRESNGKAGADIVVIENDEIILFNEEIKLKPLKQTTKLDEGLRNLTFKSDSTVGKSKKPIEEIVIDDSEDDEEKIRKLREEIDILNGGEGDDIENETDEQTRSMKLHLKAGNIPDSLMIHEARKKRELARQGDYIPVNAPAAKTNERKSRLVREEDEISDEDERVSFDVLEKSNREKQDTRNYFLAYEQGSDDEKDEEEDDVYEKWERDQIRKGVQMTQIMQMKKSDNIDTSYLEKYMGYTLEPEEMEVEAKPEIQFKNMPRVTFESIKENLRANMESFDETYRAHSNEMNMVKVNLDTSQYALKKLREETPKLNEQYTFYQMMKSYIADIVDCYNEKLFEIEKMESKWLNLMKQRSDKFISRRQEDIKDQNTEYSISFSQSAQQEGKTIDTVHQRRLADREERRSRRKKLRELSSSEVTTFDGLSSDDDETPTDVSFFNQKRSDIVSRVPDLFSDVIEDFYNYEIIKSKFQEWRLKYPSSYEDAYISLSLPKLFAPLIRLELVDWNPCENGGRDFENKKWIQSLRTYHNPSVLANEDDALLVSRIIEKTVFNKLIAIIESVYDPFSSKQTGNLTDLMRVIIQAYPSLNGETNQNTQRVFDAVVNRIRKTIENDVFVPLFPKHIIDNKSNSSSVFFYRQFWSCVKLLSNIVQWNGLLSTKTVQELSLDSLLNRYMMVALQYMDLNMETVTKIEYIILKFPKKWFENLNKNQTIPQLANLCRLLRRIVDNLQKSIKDQILFKEDIRQIRKLFVRMQAMENAIELTNTFQIK